MADSARVTYHVVCHDYRHGRPGAARTLVVEPADPTGRGVAFARD